MNCPTCDQPIHTTVERDAWGRCPRCVREGRRLPCPLPRERAPCERNWRPRTPTPEELGLGSPFPRGEEGLRMQTELEALPQRIPLRPARGVKPAVLIAQLLAIGIVGLPPEMRPARR